MADLQPGGGNKPLIQLLMLQAMVKRWVCVERQAKTLDLIWYLPPFVFTTLVSADEYLVLSTSTLSSECKCVHPPSGSVVFCCRDPPVLRSDRPTHLWPLVSMGEPLLTRYFSYLIPHKPQSRLCVNIRVHQQFVKHSCLQLSTVSPHCELTHTVFLPLLSRSDE